MKNIIIFGGTSKIASEIAILHKMNNDNIFLVGRNFDKLNKIQNKLLKEKNQSAVKFKVFDAMSSKSIDEAFEEAVKFFSVINTVIIAHSVMHEFKNQLNLEKDEINTIDINVTSTVQIINRSLKYLTSDKQIVFLSSVASQRGRGSNYAYGASKAFINVYLQGLQNKLLKKNIDFLIVNLGPVNTIFSKKVGPNFIKADPKKVAATIFKEIMSRKKQEIFVPFYWKFIMFLIKNIPNFVFNRLKL